MSFKRQAEIMKEVECLRQGFADAIGLLIPHLPKSRQASALMTAEVCHKNADRLIVKLGGESVNRKYKTID